MSAFQVVYEVLGGLGVFFYGMKTMSDGLQVFAGDVIKKVINALTTNRVMAVLVGTLVTMIVQSSSVTTVMVVGMVNAGLMNLGQAIGVIFGANIGTTITGWIISIKIGKYGLLLIGLGIFPMLFSKKDKYKHIGRLLFGVGMVFFGLEIMSSAFKPLRNMPEFLDAISYFSGQNYGAYIASILTGCLLTMVVQSSSAMLGITIAMASSGILSFHTAAALVLGENIGTTITAILASFGANTNAVRAARAHALFNCMGVFIVFCFFPYYVELIDWIVPGDPNLLATDGSKQGIAVHIATGHSVFNIVATIVFLPFLNYLAKLVVKITPDKNKKERHHLVVLGNPADLLPATALIQAEKENSKFMEIVIRMFDLARKYIEDGAKDAKTLSKIKDYERITDNIQKEITIFVAALMEKELSHEQSARAQIALRVADELESVADYIDKLSIHITRFMEDSKLDGETQQEFNEFTEKVYKFFKSMEVYLEEPDKMDMTKIDRQAETLRAMAEFMRTQHLKRVSDGTYSALSALAYSDMVVALRKIRSHTHNIGEALARLHQ